MTRRDGRQCVQVAFESNHQDGTFPDGRLTVRIRARHPGRATTDDVWFTVPDDFHAHNDSVAAALMTLVGRRYRRVSLNFAISRHCAEILAWYYRLDEIGPVDSALEPRRTGRYLALNFSGGLDSAALWVLLHDIIRMPFKVVTSEYLNFQLDRPGYLGYFRDVSCETNLRKLRYDREGRFNCAVPLLFADYADLWGVTSGHAMNHAPYSFESLAEGRPPAFRVQDATFNAGGLAEVHIARGLNEPALLNLLVTAAPERIPDALEGSDYPGRHKRAMKSLTLRYLFEQANLPIPPSLQDISLPPPRVNYELSFRAIWMVKRLGLDLTSRVLPSVSEADLSFLDDCSLDFYERYNPNLICLLPHPIRSSILAGFHTVGILPYRQHDYDDLARTRQFMESSGTRAVSPRLLEPGAPPDCWDPDGFDTDRLVS